MTDPIQRLQDLNAQHMRSMGISGVPLGEVVRSAEAPALPTPARCPSLGPQGRCVLPAAREHTMHLRGRDRWEDDLQEGEQIPESDQIADQIEVGLISLGWMNTLGEQFPTLMGDIYSLLEAILESDSDVV